MGLTAPVILEGTCDGLSAEDIGKTLADSPAESLFVFGDWRKGAPVGVDTYDEILRYAEDHYSRLRHRKFNDGGYVVIMAKPLKEQGAAFQPDEESGKGGENVQQESC